MKSKLPPLALFGVLALCAGVLGLAWWKLAPGGPRSPVDPTALEPEVGGAPSLPGGPVDAPAAEAGAAPADDGGRVALADESAPRPQLELELRSGADQPLAAAKVLLFRGEEVLGTATSDAAGLARFDAGQGRASALIAPRHAPPSVHDVALEAGRLRVALERGVAVSGRVRAVDQAAAHGVELRLVSDRPLFDDRSWPAAVRAELEQAQGSKLRLRARADEAGAFEFTGLGAPWSGRLELEDEHVLVAVTGGVWSPGADSVRLDDPEEGLALEVAALPKAIGRVVLSPGGPGVAGASVQGNLSFEVQPGEDEEATASFSGAAGDDGRFALPIRRSDEYDPADPLQRAHWPALRSASLTLDGGDAIPRRRLELAGEQLPVGFDFGELVLERGSTLSFVAVDAAAQPLAGAIGRLDGERSGPTDEAGRGSLAYSPGVARPLAVTLDGYREGRSEVPKEPGGVVRVVLTRSTRLVVVVTGPDGVAVKDASVQVTPPAQNERGRRRNPSQRTDEQGRATFSDLPAAVPLRIAVRDELNALLAEATATLETDEWRSVDVRLAQPLLSFSGVVRDEQGLALAEALVSYSGGQANQNRGTPSRRTDADGRFTFSGFSNPAGTLRASKAGFSPTTIADFRVPAPGVIVDVRLDRGQRITLRVVDDRGAPVRGDNLRLEQPGDRPFTGRRRGDNEWDFANLPRHTLVAVGMVGGREYRQEIEPLNGDQDFRVPAQGGIEIALRLDPSHLHSTLRLSLRARDNPRIGFAQGLEGVPLQTRTFAPLLPGDYVLAVSQLASRDGRNEWVNLGSTQRVTVRAGASQRVEVER